MMNGIGIASRLLAAAALSLALAGVPALADEASDPSTAAGAGADPAASADPLPPQDDPAVATDCGCAARSPAQLLETQRRMTDPAGEPGS
jgi:hypothetical protein